VISHEVGLQGKSGRARRRLMDQGGGANLEFGMENLEWGSTD